MSCITTKLKSNSNTDEYYTPKYVVEHLVEYIKPGSTIWCPFDTVDSEFVKVFDNVGFNVIWTHIDNGEDFFKINIPSCDYIISNPPFSIKDKVLERLYSFNKPFAMLLPVASIQSKFRVNLFMKYDLELLIFDKRISYFTSENKEPQKGCAFGSGFFCYKFLPEKLIFKKLEE